MNENTRLIVSAVVSIVALFCAVVLLTVRTDGEANVAIASALCGGVIGWWFPSATGGK